MTRPTREYAPHSFIFPPPHRGGVSSYSIFPQIKIVRSPFCLRTDINSEMLKKAAVTCVLRVLPAQRLD